jgi:hypothetical protein
MTERWKSVVGFEGRYDVSDMGNVRTYFCSRALTPSPTRLMKLGNKRKGYYAVNLMKDGKPHHRFVHRLVAEAFCDPSDAGGRLVLHANDNPLDNRAENLRWGTSLENSRDAMRNGRYRKGEGAPAAKITDDQARRILSFRVAGMTQSAIAREFGITQSAVSAICSGKTWGHIGPPVVTPAKLVTCAGQTMRLIDWARSLGITHSSLYGRLSRGWSLEKALTTPRRQYLNNGRQP